ncbi:MAG: electron transport complex subunit RsxE [Desulfobacteraceae bacterium]|nr:electron transport complex subunit RsxE [Desulfobacteraceae bacterium]
MATNKTNLQLVTNGILNENPIFRLVLSMCPAVGISTTVMNGLMLGVAVLFVQVFSSCTISLIKDWIHPRIRIPTYTLTIATWVTVIDMVLAAYFPTAYAKMGIFVKLIVAFAIITMRLEMFACKEKLSASFWDGVGMGLGFMFGMMAIGFVRELLGMGSILGYDVLGFRPLLFFVLPTAGFFCVGLMMGFFNYIEAVYRRAKEQKAQAALLRSRSLSVGQAGPGSVNRMAKTALRALPLVLTLLMMPVLARAGVVASTAFSGKQAITVTFSKPMDKAVVGNPANFVVYEEEDPDIRLTITGIKVGEDSRTATLTFAEPLNTSHTHVVKLTEGPGAAESFKVMKPYLGFLVSILVSALLINNFVFTKYLGLCVFFGTSKRRDTAKGMGVTFTIVMVVSAIMSWFFYQFVLKPYGLGFLQIVIFIGLVSLTVQAVDTILRKVNPVLFNAFGVYLVLVIANCVILAVPLILANNEYNFFETLMLALGAGGGFLLALYLMASVRERMELANVPKSFRGVPIAFIVAGQFALAFLGFSGLNLF